MRRGQATVFIILGVIILLTAFLGIYLYSIFNEPPKPPVLISKITLDRYISSCLDNINRSLFSDMAKNGGTLVPGNERRYSGKSFRYFCELENRLCLDRMQVTRSTMESELAEKIRLELDRCVKLERFRAQGFRVNEGEKTVTVAIGIDTTIVRLDYPVSIERGDTNQTVSKFSKEFDIPLGKLYRYAIDIINRELTGDFDQAGLMEKTGVEIEKHKPYPDTIFDIREKGLSFRFALQGENTAAMPGTLLFYDKENVLGSCKIDDQCYVNTKEGFCRGVFDPTNSCTALAYIESTDCGGSACLDCTGLGKKHGESWCVYESPSGSGDDYVGSRHERQICINGKVYTEECRDYREEICVQKEVIDNRNLRVSQSVCRPNRWHDCSAQKTKDLCRDISLRDCKWMDGLYSPPQGKSYPESCYPAVPPGFMVWTLTSGNLACNMANEKRYCDDTQCPKSWSESNAIYCKAMGDCGAYRNVADKISTLGFFSSDSEISGGGQMRDYIYPPLGLTGYITSKNNLPFEAAAWKSLNGSEFSNNRSGYKEIMEQGREYYRTVKRWSADDFAWEYMMRGEISVFIYAFALCNQWIPPFDGDCTFCGSDDLIPCSEYRCHSLGLDCMYEEVDGFGKCEKIGVGDATPPDISIRAVEEGYSAKPAYFHDLRGVELVPEAKPNKPIQISIRTDEPSRCRVGRTPSGHLLFMKSLAMFDEYEFKENHEFFITPLGKDEFGRVNDITNAYSYLDLASRIEIDPEAEIGRLSRFTGRDLTDDEKVKKVLDSLKDSLGDNLDSILKELFVSAEMDTQYFFISCIDRSGNSNTEDFFVSVTVLDETDTTPPVVTSASLDNLKGGRVRINIETDELSECRLSIYDMDYLGMETPMDCTMDMIDRLILGNFSCWADIDDHSPVFIRCRDNPVFGRDYFITFKRSTNFTIWTSRLPGGIILKEPGMINVTSMSALKENTTIVNITTDTFRLEFNMFSNQTCSYGEGRTMFCNDSACVIEEASPQENQSYSFRCERESRHNVMRESFSLPR